MWTPLLHVDAFCLCQPRGEQPLPDPEDELGGDGEHRHEHRTGEELAVVLLRNALVDERAEAAEADEGAERGGGDDLHGRDAAGR